MDIPWSGKCCMPGEGVYQLCVPLGSQRTQFPSLRGKLLAKLGLYQIGNHLENPLLPLFSICLLCNVRSQHTAKTIQFLCHHQIYHKLEINALHYLWPQNFCNTNITIPIPILWTRKPLRFRNLPTYSHWVGELRVRLPDEFKACAFWQPHMHASAREGGRSREVQRGRMSMTGHSSLPWLPCCKGN